MKRILLYTALFSITGAVHAQNATRPLTAAEERFAKNTGTIVKDVLIKAANEMSGKWIISFSADDNNTRAVDINGHAGRPHELRYTLNMEYKPSAAERDAMDRELKNYYRNMGNREPTPAERLNDPSLKNSIYVTAVINDHGFKPLDIQKALGAGNMANIPGTVFSMTNTRELGTAAPYYSIYMGDLKQTVIDGLKKLEENFPATAECTHVRTVRFDVHSNLSVASQFISKLELSAINKMIKEL